MCLHACLAVAVWVDKGIHIRCVVRHVPAFLLLVKQPSGFTFLQSLLMPNNSALQQILEHKIVAIIRGVAPNGIPGIAEALYQGGIRLVEVTLNTQGALQAIETLNAQMEGRMLIGAGTVLDAAGAKAAVAAGARFVISPTWDAETIQATRDLGAVSIPGAYTPTEVLQAFRAGGHIIKVFPAQSAAYIKDLRGPLTHIPLMPTGGVGRENIRAFQQAGAVAFGIGSSLVNAEQKVDAAYLSGITEKAGQLVAALL